MPLKQPMQMTIKATRQDPSLKDEFGKPVKAIHAIAGRFLFRQTIEELATPIDKPVPTVKATQLLIKNNTLNVLGGIYNYPGVRDGTPMLVEGVRSLELE